MSDDKKSKPTEEASPFLTTSNILQHLNTSISEHLPGNGFELHKKLPDGSSRPATDQERASADFRNKFAQTVGMLQDLSASQQLEWAEGQRQYGNRLFQRQEYKEAIDVYLTCLIVQDTGLLAQTLHNLVVSCLQLGWYAKAIEFCEIGLEKLDDLSVFALQQSKLFYLRAKASRLRGDYRPDDLRRSRALVPADRVDLVRSIDQEERLLQQAMIRAEQNRQEQKRALQKLWNTSEPSPAPPPRSDPRNRPYSKIRAPVEHEQQRELTYWEQYLIRIGRQAQKIVDWIDERERQRNLKYD